MDSLQRGVIRSKKKAVGRGMPGGGAALGAGVGYATAVGEGSLSEDESVNIWKSVILGGALGGLAGAGMGYYWSKNINPESLMRVTPNLDYMTSLWKRYALGSVGVLFRIAGDEPARMASRGYKADALMAWSKNAPITRELQKAGVGYMGPYSYEQGLTQMSYLMNNMHPNVFVSFEPTSEGSSLSHHHQDHPGPAYNWGHMQAIRAGEEPRIALARWFKAHPDTAKSMIQAEAPPWRL